MTIRAVLFDLDGTLADSHELVIVSFLAAFEREGFEVTREAVAAAIGHPFRVMVPMVVGEVDAAQLDRLGNAYGEHYRAHEAAMLKPMPHAIALLDRLAEAGVPLAIVTNRVQPSAEGAVASLGWSERFAVVVGSTVTPLPKPAADPALYALERIGVVPAEAAYVGDNEADALCAAAAGIPLVVLVGEESGHAALISAGATHTVTSLEAVADLLAAELA
jgi:HAD superfamily hydrolase (TIGR01509 family)